MGNIFRLNNLCKSYFSENFITQALHNISISFEDTGFVAITGESGSGKSTLLSILGGMESFDEGDMFFRNENVSEYSEKDFENYRLQKVSFCYQNYNLIDDYTVLENIVSALILMGKDKKAAVKKAKIYLSKVGLSGFETLKASELSSGQKQRLSIARALAKETGIILLDEPTGNLDSKTGDSIIELLAEISKEALVIMVTHNYSQCEKFVNRKIYMNSGSIISDVWVNKPESQNNIGTTKVERTGKKTLKGIAKFGDSLLVSSYFAFNNLKGSIGKSLLYFIVFLLLSCISFVFIGEIFVHRDDITTKRYTNKAFFKESDERIVCKHADGSEFSIDEIKAIRKLPHVVNVETHDIVSDINIYNKTPFDYEKIYGRIYRNQGGFTINFNSDEKFMNSVSMLSEDMIDGRLPEKLDEIVLYKDFGDYNETIYFRAQNLWDNGEYYFSDFKVVGFLKEKSEDIYFSDEFCKMMSFAAYAPLCRLCYAWDSKIDDYSEKPQMLLVIDESLKENEVRVSSKIKTKVVGSAILSVEGLKDVTVKVLGATHDSGMDFLMVSSDLFYELIDIRENQISVYIDSYANTDAVLKALSRKNYTVISTIRVSALEYINKLVQERLVIMLVCALVLLVILILGPVLLRALMKNKYKHMELLTGLGIENFSRKMIIYIETFALSLGAVLLTIIIALVLSKFSGTVMEIRQYMHITGFIFMMFFSLLLGIVTSFFFNLKNHK